MKLKEFIKENKNNIDDNCIYTINGETSSLPNNIIHRLFSDALVIGSAFNSVNVIFLIDLVTES